MLRKVIPLKSSQRIIPLTQVPWTPANHPTGTTPANHPTEVVPANHPTDTGTTPANHPTDTTPANHPTGTTPANHPTEVVPANHPTDTGTTPANHPTDTTPVEVIHIQIGPHANTSSCPPTINQNIHPNYEVHPQSHLTETTPLRKLIGEMPGILIPGSRTGYKSVGVH